MKFPRHDGHDGVLLARKDAAKHLFFGFEHDIGLFIGDAGACFIQKHRADTFDHQFGATANFALGLGVKERLEVVEDFGRAGHLGILTRGR